MLAPFSKNPLSLTLRGITSDDKDLSVGQLHLPRYFRFNRPRQGRFNTHGDSSAPRAIWYLGWTRAQSKSPVYPHSMIRRLHNA